jgi:exosortase B
VPGRPFRLAWWIAAAGLAVLYVPTLRELFLTVWSTDEQGHGPIVLGLSVWLIWRNWSAIDDPGLSRPRVLAGWVTLTIGLLVFVFGRSQRILSAQALSAIFTLSAVVLLLRGPRQLKATWFALFFMLFLVPLPAALVDAITQPMKLAVSAVAANLLYALGYPIARSGVILQVGPYQLLVADACAGLHTLFVLEAMGLLYMNVMRHSSALRNIVLAVLIVPISFTANVIRVSVLALITYHFGDAAGQGFLHGFAGMVLFLSALLLILGVDSLLRWLVRGAAPAHGGAPR